MLAFLKIQKIILIAAIVFLNISGIGERYFFENNLKAGAQAACNIDSDCNDGINCTADFCLGGVCSNKQACGGIIPCGRLVNNPNTPYDETNPCSLCHVFIMFQIIATFIVEIGGIIAVFFLVIGGLIYATSAGDQGRMETGKKAIMWALVGLAIITLAWLFVNVVLTILGYINPMGGQWNIVNCSV